jgi:hypothetical protein
VALPLKIIQLIVRCTLQARTPANVPVSCVIDAPPMIVGKDSLYPFSGEVWAVGSVKVLTAPNPDVVLTINKNGTEIYRTSPFSLIAGKIDKTEAVMSEEAVFTERDLLSFQAIPLANVGDSRVEVISFVEVGVF